MHDLTIHSKNIEDGLKRILYKQQHIEKHYRETNQRFWTIVFIDVSSSAASVWKQGERVSSLVFELYQKQVREVLEANGSCYIEPGGGPQIVCCFEDPASALLATDLAQKAMRRWNESQHEELRILPAIGIHQGYTVYRDGTIHQSNTNNMAKRIQTEAKPGQIFVSSDVQEALENDRRFALKYVKTSRLKNIPEPQDIYEVFINPRAIRNKKRESLNPAMESDTPISAIPNGQPSSQKEKFHWVFVIIDVCGSTKKFWNYGDREASELIRQYQLLCHETLKKNGCEYVASSEGDQIIAGFDPSESDFACVSGIQILQKLFRRNLKVPKNKQVRAAIGIHIGEMILQENDLVQTSDFRIGKAIQSEASDDEILLSNDVYKLLSDAVSNHTQEYGSFQPKGISKQYMIYSLQWYRANLPPALIRDSLSHSYRKNRYREENVIKFFRR